MRWLGIIIPLSRSTKTDFLLNLTFLLSFLQYISDFEERPINRRRAIRQIDNCSRSGWKGLLPLDSLLFSSWHVCFIRRNLDLIVLQEEPLNRRRAIRQIDNCSRSGWKGLLPLDSLLFSSWHVCLIRRNLDLIVLQDQPLNRRRAIRQINYCSRIESRSGWKGLLPLDDSLLFSSWHVCFIRRNLDLIVLQEEPLNRRRAIRQIDNCSRSGWKGLLPLDSLLFSSWHVCLIRRNLDLIVSQEEPLNRRRAIRQIVPDQVGNLKVRCKNDVLWFRLDFNAASVFQAYPNDPLANIEHWPVNHQSLGC